MADKFQRESLDRVMAVLKQLAKDGAPCFEDTAWMNEEDWLAIAEPLAKLLEEVRDEMVAYYL